MSRGVFLSAEWRQLCLFNYEIEPSLLSRHLPFGTSLDFIGGKTYVSLVAFMFYQTKLFGRIPAFFHEDFEEINLRFYVVRREGELTKRGVVFIKEVVPSAMLAWVARWCYGENYVAMPTGHEFEAPLTYKYKWGSNRLRVRSNGQILTSVAADSHERWISEHYWGYTRNPLRPEAQSTEYEVRHPIWDLYNVVDYELENRNLEEIYGHEFANIFQKKPDSVLLAAGSPVKVHRPTQIKS